MDDKTQSPASSLPPPSIEPPSADNEEDFLEFASAPIEHLISKNFQKSMVWFMLICAFCCFRAAIPFNVAMAYVHVGLRLVQMVGAFFRKRIVAKAAYGLSTIVIVMMFFACMIDDSHVLWV